MSLTTVVLIFLLFLVVIFTLLSIKVVPQSENWIVEKVGKYDRTLSAGLQLIIPFFESIRFRVSLQETQLPLDRIDVITKDNVRIGIKLAILYRITDASKTMYRIQNLELGIKTIINGTVRSVIGKTDLDGVQTNRKSIANEIETELTHIADEWGIVLTRVEITEVEIDVDTQDAMLKQVQSERDRRSRVTEAEGIKQQTKLQADARLYSAQKDAEAKRILADAEAYALKVVANAISDGGISAADFQIKKIQANAIQELGKGNNSKLILLPSDLISSLSSALSNIELIKK